MISPDLLRHYYPDDRQDTSELFYAWVRRDLSPDSVLLNLGAGPPTRASVRSFRGEVARAIGADVDPIVLDNDELDEAHLIEGGVLPFADATFDAIVSDFVLEHVDEPLPFLREAYRTLKPGCPFLFRTPNKNHYVTLISRLTPHAFHRLVANPARGFPREHHEPWTTRYRMNGRRALRRLAGEAGFRGVELRMVEAQPSYLLFHRIPFYLGVAWERTVNRFDFLAGLRVHILGRLEK